MISHTALAFAIMCATAGAALPETLDEATPPIKTWHTLDSDELWEFALDVTRYDLVDLETGQQRSLLVGKGKISVSWYFDGEDDVAVLTRKGNSCIVIRRGDQPTKCIAISEDPLSKSCRFAAREVRDKRTACLREATTL
jgi:hypothetical protein